MDVDTLYGIQRFLEAYEGGRKVSLQPGGEEGRIEEGDPVSLRYFKGDWYVLVRTDSDGEVHRYGPGTGRGGHIIREAVRTRPGISSRAVGGRDILRHPEGRRKTLLSLLSRRPQGSENG